MVIEDVRSDFPAKYIGVIAAFGLICSISVLSLCSWCYKRNKKTSSNFGDEDDVNLYIDQRNLSKQPLIGKVDAKDDFSFLNNVRSNTSPAKSSSGSSTKVTSPGWGQKKLKFGTNALLSNGVESMHIQPQNKDLNSSYDSLVSSWSSIPAEPELATERGEDLGSIYFSISYDVYELILKLTIQKAVNLPAKDLSGTSDPYVKVLLLPDKKNKLETRVKHKKLNPIWNEVFTFEGFPHQKLLQRSVYLQVLDYDRFSRNDPIGEVEVKLADVHLQSEPVPFVKKLKPCKGSPEILSLKEIDPVVIEKKFISAYSGTTSKSIILQKHPFLISQYEIPNKKDYLGDLLISMCYNPTSCQISVVVMKCTNLKKMDITGSCDPYIKIYLIYSGKRIDKKKSTIKKRELNPVWNETFEFDVPIDKIREISFVLTVIDFDRILPNEAIGQVIIGYRTAGQSLKHWTDMMNHPRKPIAMWHKIIKY